MVFGYGWGLIPGRRSLFLQHQVERRVSGGLTGGLEPGLMDQGLDGLGCLFLEFDPIAGLHDLLGEDYPEGEDVVLLVPSLDGDDCITYIGCRG